MAFYGDTAKIAALVNGLIQASDITIAIQEMINAYIDSEIYTYGFGSSISKIDYHDIKRTNQDTIVLERSPVISVTHVYNFFNTNNPVEIPDDEYVIELESGILQLNNPQERTIEQRVIGADVTYFASGVNAVKIEYQFGYADVPNDIANFANAIGAKFMRDFKASDSIALNLKSIKIGDYAESYNSDVSASGIVFDAMTNAMLKTLKRKYGIS